MLKPLKTKTARASDGAFAIVASRYNSEYVDAMLHAAREELLRAGAHIRIVRVPGAFEFRRRRRGWRNRSDTRPSSASA